MKKILLNTAFYYMLNEKHLALNSFGKKLVESLYTDSSNQYWIITAINSDITINICSEYHYITHEVSLDYFDWDTTLQYF